MYPNNCIDIHIMIINISHKTFNFRIKTGGTGWEGGGKEMRNERGEGTEEREEGMKKR